MEWNELIERYKKVALASVADACDSIVGRTCYMSHDMRPRIVEARVVGPALTVNETEAVKFGAPQHTLDTIENAAPGDVLVIGLERENLDVAVMGGLVAAGCYVKKMAGAILDSGIRDIPEIREKFGFPIYARSVSPGTTLGRYLSFESGVPIVCGGVRVNPGDLIVADIDGVVVVPRDKAEEVLLFAEDIDVKEAEQSACILETGSLIKGLAKHNRV